jgi:hypothetical protein
MIHSIQGVIGIGGEDFINMENLAEKAPHLFASQSSHQQTLQKILRFLLVVRVIE